MLGVELARALGVRVGDKVTLVAAGGQITPAGVMPRLKQFTLVGTFEAGHYEYDSGLALIHLDDAARFFRVEGPDRRAAAPARRARGARGGRASCRRSLGPSVIVRDWTRTNRNWFDAVQIEKRLMFIILTLIVAVAAFNLVSHAGDDGDRQARRHRHPAHAGREPALDHGHLHGAGRGRRHHRHASAAWPSGC